MAKKEVDTNKTVANKTAETKPKTPRKSTKNVSDIR